MSVQLTGRLTPPDRLYFGDELAFIFDDDSLITSSLFSQPSPISASLGGDESLSFIVEEDWQLPLSVPRIPQTAFACLDDDARATPPATIVEDDQSFVPLTQSIPWLAVAFADEEMGSGLRFVLDDEYLVKSLVQHIPWTALVFADADDWILVVPVSAGPLLISAAQIGYLISQAGQADYREPALQSGFSPSAGQADDAIRAGQSGYNVAQAGQME